MVSKTTIYLRSFLKTAIFVLLGVSLLFCTSCNFLPSPTAIEDMEFCQSMSVDKSENGDGFIFGVALKRIKPSSGGTGDDGGGDATVEIIQQSGKSFSEIIQLLQTRRPKIIFFGDIETILVSDKVLTHNFKNFVDFFVRSRDFSEYTTVFAIKDNALDVLQSMQKNDRNSVDIAIKSKSIQASMWTKPINFLNMIRMLEDNSTGVIPIINEVKSSESILNSQFSILNDGDPENKEEDTDKSNNSENSNNKNKSDDGDEKSDKSEKSDNNDKSDKSDKSAGDKKSAGDEKDKDKSEFEVAGYVLISDSKMVGVLDKFMARGLNAIKNDIKDGKLSFDIHHSGKKVTVGIDSLSVLSRIEYKSEFEFDIIVKVDAAITELSDNTAIPAHELIKLSEAQLTEIFTQDISNCISQCKLLKSDVIGLYQSYRWFNKDEAKKLKPEWNEIFQHSTVNVNVSSQIKRTHLASVE